MPGRWRRHIQSWIAIKKACWLKHESGEIDRHYRPILRPGDMINTYSVPEY